MSVRAKWMAQCISDIFGAPEYETPVSVTQVVQGSSLPVEDTY